MAAAGINAIRFGVGWWVLAETAAECQPMVEGGYQQVDASRSPAYSGRLLLTIMHEKPNHGCGISL